MQTKKLYPTDLTDSQWNLIKEILPEPARTGRPRELELRQIVNAILYLVRSGIQWRMMPREYPKWQSVYYYFQKWRKDGTWKRVHDTFRAQERRKKGRHKHPTAASIDSQSVEGTLVGGIRGYDAGKKVNGRKRHIVVDTLGLVLAALVTPASVSDPAGARKLIRRLGGAGKKLQKIWTDGTYRGSLLEWVEARFRFVIEPVSRPEGQKGFLVLPKRWVVERTFAWFDANRRLSRDYERLTNTSETIIYIAMIAIMVRRLA